MVDLVVMTVAWPLINGLYPTQDVVFSLFSWWRAFLSLVAG
jgi:hypothetical protein